MLFIRMILHYIGQYTLLKIMDCPVTEFSFDYYRLKLRYGYSNVYQEIGVVIIGPIFNTLLFIFMVVVIK